MHAVTQRFTDALHQLHADRDVEPLVALFSEDATLSKLDHPHEEHGLDGARRFWQTYRDVFDDIEATFSHTVQAEDSSALEWNSHGTLRDGKAFSYKGVSVLQGSEDRISGFRTYYDSVAFLADTAPR